MKQRAHLGGGQDHGAVRPVHLKENGVFAGGFEGQTVVLAALVLQCQRHGEGPERMYNACDRCNVADYKRYKKSK